MSCWYILILFTSMRVYKTNLNKVVNKRNIKQLIAQNGEVYKEEKVCRTVMRTDKLLDLWKTYHEDASDRGRRATARMVNENYYMLRTRAFVDFMAWNQATFVSLYFWLHVPDLCCRADNCLQCQRAGKYKFKPEPKEFADFAIPDRLWQIMHVDCAFLPMSKNGNAAIVLCCDRNSGYVEASPIPQKMAGYIASFLVTKVYEHFFEWKCTWISNNMIVTKFPPPRLHCYFLKQKKGLRARQTYCFGCLRLGMKMLFFFFTQFL